MDKIYEQQAFKYNKRSNRRGQEGIMTRGHMDGVA